MRASPTALAASLIACAVLATLPACGLVWHIRPDPPRTVAVTEADGSVRLATAASMGIGSIHRHAGQHVDYHEVRLEGSEAWGLLGFFGVLACVSLVGTLIRIIVVAIQDSASAAEETP